MRFFRHPRGEERPLLDSRFEPPLRWLLLGAGGLGAACGALVRAVRAEPRARGPGGAPPEARPIAPRRMGCRRFD